MVITDHLTECRACHQLFADTLGNQRGSAPVRFSLEPEYWLRHDHLDFEQLVAIADEKLDATDREMIDIHCAICESCREDVRKFLAFCKEIEPELHVRYGPQRQKPQPMKTEGVSWLRPFPWKPAYAAAFLLLGIAIVVAVLVIKRRAANFEAGHQPSQNNNVAIVPVPTTKENGARQNAPPPIPVPPNERPRPNPSQSLTVKEGEPVKENGGGAAVAAIRDGLTIVTVDRGGTISGIDDASATTRREVSEVLVAEEIKTSNVQNALSSPEGTLRGTNTGPPFRLISPARVVILTDRPSFQWERLRSASSYRVYVGDGKGHEVAKSEELSASRTAWRVSVPLKRGEIYSWAVAAIVDGKEVFSPGPAAPEMKFQCLPTEKVRELAALKKTRSHLALGVFYAKAGMIADAEHQFRILIRLNPDSLVLKKLLAQIESWEHR